MERFHVAATGHSVSYFPEFLARAHGMFEAVGLDVTANVPDPWERVLTDLRDGRAEAVIGGIWVPAMYAGTQVYRAFAQLTARAPVSLVARAPIVDFDWSFLAGKVVLVSGGGHASQYLFLESVVTDAGLDPASVRFLHDLPDGMFRELFRGGIGDVLVTDDLTAAVVAREGGGHVVARLIELGPRVPWSVYYSTPERRVVTEPLVRSFTAGLSSAFEWLAANGVRAATDVARTFWPDLDVGLVLDVLERLEICNVWESMTVHREGLASWQTTLAKAGLSTEVLDYETLVDATATENAYPHR